MDLLVDRNGAHWGAKAMRCALGRAGISAQKREGDGATPAGSFPMRRLLYRADRIASPATALPLAALLARDGWCDTPGDAAYNRMVTLPYGAGAERLWRDDALYDLIVPLGYNDDPPESGLGSAIFLHVARPDYAPTEGCVALSRADLLTVLREADRHSRVAIAPA
jgi:L,D-peptidoglycan transpeptidase YkuD (ErfK/YbiS/YcfS/YnhG family)